MLACTVYIAAVLMLYEMAIFGRRVLAGPKDNIKVNKTRKRRRVSVNWYKHRSFLDFDDVVALLESEALNDEVSMRLTSRLNETLVEFLYPTNEERASLRLPDGYFSSALAEMVRKPRFKFKHLRRFYSRLFVERQPLHVTVFGGSITAGSGMGKSQKEVRLTYNASYAVRLERWLNKFYPPRSGSHIVHNFGRGAVGSCYFSLLVEKLADPRYLGGETDLFILETSVNDVLSKDMACFDQLVSKIISTYPNASVVSLHLTTGSDFLKSCFVKPLTLLTCEDEIEQTSRYYNLTRLHQNHMRMWCQKRQIVNKYELLQIDLNMLLNLFCAAVPPFQHAYDTAEMTLYSFAHKIRSSAAQQRLLDSVANANETELNQSFPLLTQGSYFSSHIYDGDRMSAYKEPFEAIGQAILSKLGYVPNEPGMLGDMVLFATDRKHLGRWGHLLVAAELAVWFTWMEVVGPSAMQEDTEIHSVHKVRTIWAAVTFDLQYYSKRSGIKGNKHKPVSKGAKLDIHPLKPVEEAAGWKLYDDAGMQKQGYITQSKEPRNITFKLPKLDGGPDDIFTVRLGFLKSYTQNMGHFAIDVHDTYSDKHITTVHSGYHEDLVSVFVDTVVGVVAGTNDISLTVTSRPVGKARKIKLVAVYVTQHSRSATESATGSVAARAKR